MVLPAWFGQKGSIQVNGYIPSAIMSCSSKDTRSGTAAAIGVTSLVKQMKNLVILQNTSYIFPGQTDKLNGNGMGITPSVYFSLLQSLNFPQRGKVAFNLLSGVEKKFQELLLSPAFHSFPHFMSQRPKVEISSSYQVCVLQLHILELGNDHWTHLS